MNETEREVIVTQINTIIDSINKLDKDKISKSDVLRLHIHLDETKKELAMIIAGMVNLFTELSESQRIVNEKLLEIFDNDTQFL